MAADHRSIIPTMPGVPWWAAVVIGVTATAAGFAFDAGSGNKELTGVFSALYVIGCLAAVLAVRQAGVFTAVIQPPLILFCAVPGAYWLFHGAKIAGLKDLLINCGYPLIERFPLMLFTSAAVLLIGMVRWYLGMAARSAATGEADTASERKDSLVAKLASLLGRQSAKPEHTSKTATARTRRSQRSTRSAKATSERPARRAAASRSRHVRPPLDDDPAVDRTRRRRPAPARDADLPDPPRRTRTPRDPDLRGRPPREIRRDPHVRRSGAATRRSSRFDPYDPIEPYEPAKPAEPPRRRPAPTGATATHHPISRVRYRNPAPPDQT
ncbi:hypothetical protein BST20_19450 [Mycobacterium branderi]|uniref:DUF6542 domain-containing protein n=1 Tax=Mycobacterium branderi TaxID=43348 RepID=A0AA91LUN1_9MYCO|nr:hypothetical protein BST20_19450 [Mycobacterium branderi]